MDVRMKVQKFMSMAACLVLYNYNHAALYHNLQVNQTSQCIKSLMNLYQWNPK